MRIKWATLLFKMTVWLGAELTLTVLGFDDLADYGEFIFKGRDASLLATNPITLVITT